MYTDDEKAAYQPETCDVCGTPKEVMAWYADKKITHMTGSGLW
jgi:hypothetical protein